MKRLVYMTLLYEAQNCSEQQVAELAGKTEGLLLNTEKEYNEFVHYIRQCINHINIENTQCGTISVEIGTNYIEFSSPRRTVAYVFLYFIRKEWKGGEL